MTKNGGARSAKTSAKLSKSETSASKSSEKLKLKRKLVSDDAEVAPEKKSSSKRRKTENSAATTGRTQSQKKPRRRNSEVGKGVDEQQAWCHQCRRNDRGRVIRCKKCQTKNYCVLCATKWYPNVSEEAFAEACPVCRHNCNCKACLRGFSPKNMQGYSCCELDKIEYSKQILRKILPFVKHLHKEQLMEKEIEAKIKGLSLSEIELRDAKCAANEDIFCNNCGTYMFDFYRSCELCSYDLCLVCCRNLRDGCLHICKGVTCDWKSHEDGSIPCPPKDIGGCGYGVLELKHIMPVDRVSNVLEKAQGMLEIDISDTTPQTCPKCLMCCDSGNESLRNNGELREASMQENPNANSLYCPSAKEVQPEDMRHFQWHWAKGEPVIVSDVLSTASGLSWEPMVMWRAFRDVTRSHVSEVKAINCLDWSEVKVDLYQFFRGYLEGRFDKEGLPQVLKLENCKPSCPTEHQPPRHFIEFISCLPFKDYTHPHSGYLNVAVKLPKVSVKPDMGPRMDIVYGFEKELERGNSVTKLHLDKFDTVNVMTHTKSVVLASKKLDEIQTLKQKHIVEDQRVAYEEAMETNVEPQHVADRTESGALWDIFPRQDLPKLEEYLMNHSAEFRLTGCLAAEKVCHPIHDRTFYLTMEHKRKLKEEFGIEPWTFTQKLGDAVFVPAGSPYQVRNLQSNTKVELNFISPESVGNCIRLQQELRMLPIDHKAKQEKLNIGKIMLYALEDALSTVMGSDRPGDSHRLSGCDGSTQCDHTNGWLYDTHTDGDSEETCSDRFDLDQFRIVKNGDFPALSPSGPSMSVRSSSTVDGSPSADANRTTEHGPLVEDSGTGTSREDPDNDGIGVWRGHAVGEEAGRLLRAVERRYPDTFAGIQTRLKSVWVSILTEFHVMMKGFLETPAAVATAEQVKGLREDLCEFERFGLDLSWAHERLRMVEEIKPLLAMEQGMEPLKEKVIQRRKEYMEAECELAAAKATCDEKAAEVAERFGADYDRVLNGHLGFGMLPGY